MSKVGRHLSAREQQEATEIILTLAASGTSIRRACSVAGVNQSTFWRWRLKDVALDKRLKDALTENVGRVYTSALQEALGYDYVEITQQRNADGELETTKTVAKHCRASVAAMDLWLRNRDSEYKQRLPETVTVKGDSAA